MDKFTLLRQTAINGTYVYGCDFCGYEDAKKHVGQTGLCPRCEDVRITIGGLGNKQAFFEWVAGVAARAVEEHVETRPHSAGCTCNVRY